MSFTTKSIVAIGAMCAMAACSSGQMPAPGPSAQYPLGSMGVSGALPNGQGHRLRPNIKAPAIWVNNPSENEIIGTNKSGAKVVGKPITTTDNGCYAGFGMKVDHTSNIWESCIETFAGSALAATGGVSKYDKNGHPVALYQGGCPSNLKAKKCRVFTGQGSDVAVTSKTVFVTNVYMHAEYACGSKQCYQDYEGWEYWPNGSPSKQPAMIDIKDGISGWTIVQLSYSDVDNSGNLWTFAYACENSNPSICGTGIVEVKKPTTSPSAILRVAFGTLAGGDYSGMVYVSNQGKVLNVTDPLNGTTYQYALLPSFTGTPFNLLGPVGCEPLLGGFSKGDTTLVQADICYSGQLDFINVATNTPSTKGNSGLDHPTAAQFAISDK